MIISVLRNLQRNRRRTTVMILLVGMASFLVCSLRFLGYGMHQQMIWSSAGILSGYVQVAAHGWVESRALERALDSPPELMAALRRTGATALSGRIESPALINSGSESRFVTVTALDSVGERGLVTLPNRIVQGRFVDDRPDISKVSARGGGQRKLQSGMVRIHECVLGERLARFLDVGLGDTVFVVGTQFDGSVGALRLKIVGIFRTLSPELDFGRVVVPVSAGRELFAPDGEQPRYTSILLGARSQRHAQEILAELRRQFPSPNDPSGVLPEESRDYSPVALSWEDLNPELVSMMALDQAGNEMFIVFLLLILGFGILNSVQMTVHERLRELGVLIAIGTRPWRLLLMLASETLLVVLPATLVGAGTAILLAAYLQRNPIAVSQEMGEFYQLFGFQPVIQSVPDAGELWVALASLLVPAIGFVFFGTRRVLRLNPVEIMRSY